MRLTLLAYAKINMTLEALARRTDGYHEIASVLQSISLADTLSFEPSETLDLRCNVLNLQSADNLVLKAAKLLREATGCSKGASIQLAKEIPVAAGLGSGAADAAATLIGLNRLWELNLPLHRLLELAPRLGSDTAFFLYGGTALATGRGDKVTPVPPIPQLWLVLLRPAIEPFPDKTAQLYSQLNASHFTSGQFTKRLVDNLHTGQVVSSSLLFNVFESVAFDFFPQLSRYRFRFLTAGAESVRLAGAGPTLFALVPDRAQGEAILNRLKGDGLEAYLVRTEEAVP